MPLLPPPPKLARLRLLLRDQTGATMLEYCLLMAIIAFGGYWIIARGLDTLVEHYRLMTMLNSLPFP